VSTFCTLEGRLALVTGGSRGIGRAIAVELANAGAQVVVGYRSGADEAGQVAAEIGGRAVQADVSDPEQAARLVEEAGAIDILVNNAGLTRDGLIARMSDEDWRTVIASKAGIIGFTKALARELATRSVRANAIAPGYIETGLTEVLPDGVRDALLASTPLGRLGVPSDVAGAVRFLCSDEASFITGEVLLVDGGLGM